MKYAKVKFIDGFKEYHFITDIDDLEENDQIVVDTRNGLTIGIFVGYITFPKQTAIPIMRWVVQKVDTEGLKERIKKAEEAKTLKRKLDYRRKQLLEMETFEKLAENDTEIRNILDQYKEVTDYKMEEF